MIFTKIWEKMFFKNALKFIFFFSVAIYIIFFILDFSLHGTRFYSHTNATILDIFIYYYHNFITYLNLFLSLALMLSIIKTIYSANINNELTALQVAGISKYKLATPFFFIAFILTSLSYLNNQMLTPKSAKAIEAFKTTYSHSKKRSKASSLRTVLLDDSSKIIYQKYDPTKKKILDVFWIKSIDDIWHIKSLSPLTTPPQGMFVDHFMRNQENKLVMQESFKSYAFFQMNFDKAASASLEPFEFSPISTLYLQFKNKRYSSSKEKALLLSHLNYKLALPLLPFLIVIALLPFCIRFSRTNHIYMISAVSLFCFIAFFILMDAAIILAENQVGNPFIIIWVPFICSFLFFGKNFIKKHAYS